MLSRLAFAVREPQVRAVLARHGSDTEVLAALAAVELQSVGRARAAEEKAGRAQGAEPGVDRVAGGAGAVDDRIGDKGVDLREPAPRRPEP
jgi:hypothetical protein